MTKPSNNTYSLKKWLLAYTISFLCIGLILWRPFYTGHKSMIWGYDGLYQTYAAMVYISKYWRDFFSNLLTGTFCLPMVDPSIGTGFDVLTTLNYYGFGDPLLWLSLLFPTEKMELCYNILAILRYYLAGVTFGIYCHAMGKPAIPAIGGAFVYIFSGFALYAGVRHPYFMNPWITFPLLCLGVEQVLQGKKGTLLAVTAGISACSNFYFFYMLTILTFLYAVIRFGALYHRRWKENLGRIFFAGCGWYLLGITLGAVILIPDVLALLASARVGTGAAFTNTWFLYPLDFYKQLLAGYFFPVYTADYWCVLVYPASAYTGLLVLGNWKRERQNLWLGAWFLILSLLLWIPLGGWVMNGLSYVSHRWVFGYSFCMALLFILGVEKAEQISKKGIVFLTLFFLGAAGLFFKDSVLNGGIDWKISAGFAGLFLVSVMAIVCIRKRLLSCLLVFCAILTVLLSAQSLYSDSGIGYISQFPVYGSALGTMTRLSEVSVAGEMQETAVFSKASVSGLDPGQESSPSFSRIEGDTPQETNWGLISGLNGANSYFSLTRKEIYDYAYILENPDLKFPSWYNGYGERAALLCLNSVRYFAKKADGDMAVPYGYVQKQEFPDLDMGSNGILYESPYAMPLGYTYDQVLPSQKLEDFSALQTQQAFMQAAVLEPEAISALKGQEDGVMLIEESDCAFDHTPLPFTICSMEGLTWDPESGLLSVGESGGQITVQYHEADHSETYLRVCGFDIEESGYEMLHFFVGAEGTQEKKIYCTSSVSAWNGKLKNFLVLVSGGTAGDDGKKTVRIRFPFSGTFRLHDLELYSLPMDSFVKQANARKTECLDATLALNQIKGSISVTGNRILCVSIPYSEGWSAMVDGQKVPVWKCNRMHLGILLEEGEHEVIFSYQTPGLAAGAAISALSLLLVIGLSIVSFIPSRTGWR